MSTKRRGEGGYLKGSSHVVKTMHLTSVPRPHMSAWPNVEKSCYGTKPCCAMRESSCIGDVSLRVLMLCGSVCVVLSLSTDSVILEVGGAGRLSTHTALRLLSPKWCLNKRICSKYIERGFD